MTYSYAQFSPGNILLEKAVNAGLYYTGYIDEVALWSVALAASDVNNLYNSYNPCNVVCGYPSLSTITPYPVVNLLDAYGNLVSSGVDASANVTLVLKTGDGSLIGSTTAIAAAGVANFTNLSFSIYGNKTLKANALVASGNNITVSSANIPVPDFIPTQLVFSSQPGGGMVGTAWSTQPVVQIEDMFNNIVASGAYANSNITMTLSQGQGVLSGNVTVAATAGIANVVLLSTSVTGNDKELTATMLGSSGNITATTPNFIINNGPFYSDASMRDGFPGLHAW